MIQWTPWALAPAFTLLTCIGVQLWSMADLRAAPHRALRWMNAALIAWAGVHLLRMLTTTLATKAALHVLLLPLMMTIGAALLLFVFQHVRLVGPVPRPEHRLLFVPGFMTLLLALPETSRRLLFSELELTGVGTDFVGLAIELGPLGRAAYLLPFAFLATAVVVLLADAWRTPGRRRSSLLFAGFCIVVAPLHHGIRQLWMDGTTPVNLTPLVMASAFILVSIAAWALQRRSEVAAVSQTLAALPCVLLICDGDGVLRDVNPAGEALLRGRRETLTGQRLGDLLGLDPTGLGDDGHLSDWQAEFGGQRRRFDVSVTALASTETRVLMYACVLEDRTQYLRARESLAALTDELIEQSSELEQINTAKRQFLSRSSGTLRGPLETILADTRALRDDLDAEARGFVDEIEQSARHLLSLVDDITVFEQTGRDAALEIADVDLQALIEGLLRQFAPLAEPKAIELGAEFDPAVSTWPADARKLRQVLTNLLSNAIKFTPAGGAVTVSTRRVDGACECAVADTGVGIAATDADRVFEPFEQVDGSLSRQHGGTGLGLPLVRRLVQAHGGSIHLESAPGEGARFVFTLPVRDGSHANPATGASLA